MTSYLWVLITTVVFESDGSSFSNERMFKTEKQCITYMLKNECEVKRVRKSYLCKQACVSNTVYTAPTIRVTEPDYRPKKITLEYGPTFTEDDI